LRNLPTAAADLKGYLGMTLPQVSTMIFRLTCVPDLQRFMAILSSPAYPQLAHAIVNVELTGFHWFSGIAHNRRVNPSLELLASLPNVAEATIHLHSAGLTGSVWLERERLRMENAGDLAGSKRLKVLRLSEIVAKYDLNKIYACSALRVVNLVVFDSAEVRSHCNGMEPLSQFRLLRNWLMTGFLNVQGHRVDVYLFKEKLVDKVKVREAI
jgi:hypothetical protein